MNITLLPDGGMTIDSISGNEIAAVVAIISSIRGAVAVIEEPTTTPPPALSKTLKPKPQPALSKPLLQTWQALANGATTTPNVAVTLGIPVATANWRLRKLRDLGAAKLIKRGVYKAIA